MATDYRKFLEDENIPFVEWGDTSKRWEFHTYGHKKHLPIFKYLMEPGGRVTVSTYKLSKMIKFFRDYWCKKVNSDDISWMRYGTTFHFKKNTTDKELMNLRESWKKHLYSKNSLEWVHAQIKSGNRPTIPLGELMSQYNDVVKRYKKVSGVFVALDQHRPGFQCLIKIKPHKYALIGEDFIEFDTTDEIIHYEAFWNDGSPSYVAFGRDYVYQWRYKSSVSQYPGLQKALSELDIKTAKQRFDKHDHDCYVENSMWRGQKLIAAGMILSRFISQFWTGKPIRRCKNGIKYEKLGHTVIRSNAEML